MFCENTQNGSWHQVHLLGKVFCIWQEFQVIYVCTTFTIFFMRVEWGWPAWAGTLLLYAINFEEKKKVPFKVCLIGKFKALSDRNFWSFIIIQRLIRNYLFYFSGKYEDLLRYLGVCFVVLDVWHRYIPRRSSLSMKMISKSEWQKSVARFSVPNFFLLLQKVVRFKILNFL